MGDMQKLSMAFSHAWLVRLIYQIQYKIGKTRIFTTMFVIFGGIEPWDVHQYVDFVWFEVITETIITNQHKKLTILDWHRL